MSSINSFYVYDIETYAHLFTFSIVRADGVHKKTFRVDKFKNQIKEMFKCFDYLEDNDLTLVGFNNLAFDYPIIHEVIRNRKKLMSMEGAEIASFVFELAQKQIDSFKGERFGNTVKADDVRIRQVDLYKIHHFDNKARATSLKMLEFNMRMDNIEDLPFDIREELDEEKIQKIINYNEHDTEATRQFLLKSQAAIDQREQMTQTLGVDFTNFNDGKIGKQYFIMKLEEKLPGSCYSYDARGKKKINQTKRPFIKIKDCLFDYYNFEQPAFIAVFNWFKDQKITETKGVFSDIDESNLGEVAKYAELTEKRKKFKGVPTEYDKAMFKMEHPLGWIEEVELKGTTTVIQEDGTKVKVPKKSYWMVWREAETLNVVINGFRFDFGTGGIHGSIESKVARSTKKYKIKDADVSSMYPNIGIANKVYPKHLGVEFCEIYEDVYNQRKQYAKGTPENSVMKLALNSVYGDSNNQYSPFYDPQYTMTITINGQLSLCLLAEQLLKIPELKIIQVNTDGITVAYPHEYEDMYMEICTAWQKQVGLELEYAEYERMIIRDVNNYIALYTNGKIKRKGAYQYEDLGWHQNQSSLVIPMAAEAYMLHGTPLEEFIRNHKEKFDFCLRTKVPRSSKLVLRMTCPITDEVSEIQQQNICRYYPAKNGGKLVKLMPALEGKEDTSDRELSIDAKWNVKTCNNISDFSWDDLDYDYYIEEAQKLVIE